MSGAEALRTAYEAKALAELAEADAVIGAAPGTWDGKVVGARIAFVTSRPAAPGTGGGVLDLRTGEAVALGAEALGAGDDVFLLATRSAAKFPREDRARRLRLAVEAVDAPAVIALDADAAQDLAFGFGLGGLQPGAPVRAFGRTLGSAGDFAASLDDPAAKARAWAAMKAVAARAGLKAKGRPKAPDEGQGRASG